MIILVMIADYPYLSELLFEDDQIEISGLPLLRHNFQKLMRDLIMRQQHYLLINL